MMKKLPNPCNRGLAWWTPLLEVGWGQGDGVSSTSWGKWGTKQEEKVLWISPITSEVLPHGDSRTSPAQILGVLLASGATGFAGKTTALSVMGRNLWTCCFLHKPTSSARRKVQSCPVAEFKTDWLVVPELLCHLQVPSY